jgi:glyoxylase-like metal-dependent hydrolase (beta-lactamase superfamily II)
MTIRSHRLFNTLALLGGLLAPAGRLFAAAPPAPPPPLPEGVAPFEVATSSPTSWYGRFGWTNVAWIDMGDGVLLIDTGATLADAENIKAKIKETTKGKPVRWVVITHPHADNTGALDAFAGEASFFANVKAAGPMALHLGREKTPRIPTVVGVTQKAMIASGGNVVELVAIEGSAHTSEDLIVFHRATGIAYVGDLVTPNRCPMMSDSSADPRGWVAALDQIALLHPALLVATRGDASPQVEAELNKTRAYVKRVTDLLSDFKKGNTPEARVAAELVLRKLGDYCPTQLDNANVLKLYQRADASGNVKPAAPSAAKPAAKPAPAKRKG